VVFHLKVDLRLPSFAQVVTKRTKNLKKQEIPSLDDPISKLNHIGKETVKKLNELQASADEASLMLKIPKDLFKYAWTFSLRILTHKFGVRHQHFSGARPQFNFNLWILMSANLSVPFPPSMCGGAMVYFHVKSFTIGCFRC
jgi:hypothetical protein